MNSYLFSDDQLALLSSLMNGKIVYGIESKLFHQWQYIDKKKIQDIYNRLQDNQWIYTDYNGKIRIQKQLYEMLEVLVHPSELLCLTKSYFSGNREVLYYYKKEDRLVELKRQNQFHYLNFVDNINIEFEEPLTINEKISSLDIEKVNDFLEWFDEDGAISYLSNISKDSKSVLDILNKNYDEFKIEYYIWDKNELSKTKNLIVGLMNNLMFEWIEEDDVIEIVGGHHHLDSIIHSLLVGVKK